jgi:SPP1 gp7 family putative phage head morphogenesis protein
MITPRPYKQPIDWLAIIKRLQSQLNKSEAKYTNQIIEAYKKSYKTITPYIRNIQLLLEARPDITPYALKRTPEFRALVNVADEELRSFTDYAKTTLAIAIEASALLGLASAKSWGMTPVAPSALDVITRFLQPDTALYERIGLWAGNARDGVIQAIIEGVGLGKNPVTIGQEITRAFGTELTDAIRASRTAQLWAYRESTRLNYIANGIDGWVWMAELDETTCGACAAMHGTFHSNEEQLDGHYNCRCVMIPATAADVIHQSGEEFWRSLSQEEQDKMLGEGRAQALRDGKIAFGDLAQRVDDKTYGHMVTETPLKDLIDD